MVKNTALYISADPMTFNDESLIRRCVKAFGFVYIILDRRNRDAEYQSYSLSYADRSDIIKHELKDIIDGFQILPIDMTVQKTVFDNQIGNVVLNLDYQKETSFKMQKALQRILKGVNVLCMQGDGFLGSNFINTLVKSDSSMKLYKDFCSDYAYAKFKVKTMTKIGVTGNMGSGMEIVVDTIRERQINVIDLDEYTFRLYETPAFIQELETAYAAAGVTGLSSFIHRIGTGKIIDKCDILRFNLRNEDAERVFQKILYAKIQQQIMKCIMAQFSDVIVIKFVLIYEYAMEKMFDRIVAVGSRKEIEMKRLSEKGYDIQQIDCFFELEQDINEKMEYADYRLYSNDGDQKLKNDTVMLLNTKLSDMLKV